MTTVTVTVSVAKPRLQLKRRLRRLGITQDVIAARAGVTRTYVNHYLAGRRSPAKLRVVIEELIAEAKAPPQERAS